MNIKKEPLSDNEGGTIVARRTKRQKTSIDWSFLKHPRKKLKTHDNDNGVALSTGTAPAIHVKQEKQPEDNLQLGEGTQDAKCNIGSSHLPDERSGVAKVDSMEKDWCSKSTRSAVSGGEISKECCGAIPDHCYAVKPRSKKMTKPEPRAKPVEKKKVPRPTVDLATLAVYRALIDHTYSSITPSHLIDAVMLKHHYICTIQNIELQEDYSSKASYAEDSDSKYNQASNSQPSPKPSSKTGGTVTKKEVKPKKVVSPSKSVKSLPKGSKAVMKLEKTRVTKKVRSPKGCPTVKLRKRETSAKSQKVSMKKTVKLSTKQMKVSPTRKVEVDENEGQPSLSTTTEEPKMKSKKRRRRNQTGWPTKSKAQPKKSSVSVDKAEIKNAKSRPAKKTSSSSRDSSARKALLKSVKVEKDDASKASRVNVSIEEAVKRRHQSLSNSKGGRTSKKKLVEEGKYKSGNLKCEAESANLDEQEKGTSKLNRRKGMMNLSSCIKKEVTSSDEGDNSEPERNGVLDDAETRSDSVDLQANSLASSLRKSVVSRTTSSSPAVSAKVNTKGVKSTPVGRSPSKKSLCRSEDPPNKSDVSTSKKNKTEHSKPSSACSVLQEMSRSTRHRRGKADAKDRSLASETKKPLMIIKSEVGETDDAVPSSDGISTVDTAESRVPSPERMSLRKRIKRQVASLCKPLYSSKSKSSQSQTAGPVKVKQEIVTDEHHALDSSIDASTDGRGNSINRLRSTKTGRPKTIWGHTNDGYSSTGESTTESQYLEEPGHDTRRATSSKITDNKSDEHSKNLPNVDDEDRCAGLGVEIVKVETMHLEFMTGDSYPGKPPEDIDESVFASTSNENSRVQSPVEDLNEDRCREVGSEKDLLLCNEDFECDSDSYPNDEPGEDAGVGPEAVDPPLENLDYTGWKNTKTIYTSDASDSKFEDECSSAVGSCGNESSCEATEFRNQCEPSLGDNEDDEVRKSEIMRVIGCSGDIGVEPIDKPEQLKSENSTGVVDSTSDSEVHSPIERVVRRYTYKTCQTDREGTPQAGSDLKPAVGCSSNVQDEHEPDLSSPVVVLNTEKTQKCDLQPANPTFVDLRFSSNERKESQKMLAAVPLINNSSTNRSHCGTQAGSPLGELFPKQTLGANNTQFERIELEDDPTSSVLGSQVEWDLRIQKRRDKLRKLKQKQQKCRQKLKSLRSFSLSGNGLVARFLRGGVGLGSIGRRCSFYQPAKPAGDRSYPISLATSKSDGRWSGGTHSRNVVDLTKCPEVDQSRVGSKLRRLFRGTPTILRRRPEVKNLVKPKKTDPCRVLSMNQLGKPRPLLPKRVSAETPQEERRTVLVHPPQCDPEKCTAGHVPPTESSQTRADPQEVPEMSLECTEDLTEILSDDEGAGADATDKSDVDSVRLSDVLHRPPRSLTSEHTPEVDPEGTHHQVEDAGLESQDLQRDPLVLEPALEMGMDVAEAHSCPPVVGPACETDHVHQHPVTENPACKTSNDSPVHRHSTTEMPTCETNINSPVNQQPTLTTPAFETFFQDIGKMDSVGRRATAKRDKDLKESQRIIDEHAYCLKGSPSITRMFEGNKRFISAERANFVSEKLITKNFPQVTKKKSVTVNVSKTRFAGETQSWNSPRTKTSPDPYELSGIIAPLPAPKTDSVPPHAPGDPSRGKYQLNVDIDGGSNTAESNNDNEESLRSGCPSLEIANLELRVRKRLNQRCRNMSLIRKNGRPPFSYQTMAAMAIESDPLKAARASDICDFMQKHFSFYRNITSRWWKQNLRSVLCTSKVFRSDRIGKRVYFSFCKELRLPGDPAIYEMLDEPPERDKEDIEKDDPFYNEFKSSESGSPLDLFTPEVDLHEPSELDPLIPICSYSDDESDGFPVIVDTATYTGDRLPVPGDDEYGPETEVKNESDEGVDCERPAEPTSVSTSSTNFYACPYCPAVFDTVQGNLDHSVIHPEVMKPCPVCDFSSPDEVQLVWHVNSAHR